MVQRTRVYKSLSRCVFLSALIFSLACEDEPRITTQCDLTEYVTFINAGTDSLRVILVDSTEWTAFADLQSHETDIEDTFTIIDSSVVFDTMRINWIFEHYDVYSEAEACSAGVDLGIFARVYRHDSLISNKELGIGCFTDAYDTSFVDTNGVVTDKFIHSKTLFLP